MQFRCLNIALCFPASPPQRAVLLEWARTARSFTRGREITRLVRSRSINLNHSLLACLTTTQRAVLLEWARTARSFAQGRQMLLKWAVNCDQVWMEQHDQSFALIVCMHSLFRQCLHLCLRLMSCLLNSPLAHLHYSHSLLTPPLPSMLTGLAQLCRAKLVGAMHRGQERQDRGEQTQAHTSAVVCHACVVAAVQGSCPDRRDCGAGVEVCVRAC